MPSQEELEQMSPEEIAALQKQNCPFCKIIKGEIPSRKIYEDEDIIAILDINPASKGHMLIMPKEHIPILPLVPPLVFKKLFLTTKILARAAKETLMASGISIFIANGAVAGQQSPHFLFHIIPREVEDNLNNFIIPQDDSLSNAQDEFASVLKNKLATMLQSQKVVGQKNVGQEKQVSSSPLTSQSNIPVSSLSPEQIMKAKKVHIATMIKDNPDVAHLLKNNPEEFKELIKQNTQVEELFRGVDIDALSENLKSLDKTEQGIALKNESKEDAKEQVVATQEISTPKDVLSDISKDTSRDTSRDTSKDNINDGLHDSVKPISEGTDSQQQRIFAYFKKKPKAKDLFLSDLAKFKELLALRKDVQPIFENSNLEKLAKQLKAQEEQAQKGGSIDE